MYRVVLTVDGKEYPQSLRMEIDPVLATTVLAAEGKRSRPNHRAKTMIEVNRRSGTQLAMSQDANTAGAGFLIC